MAHFSRASSAKSTGAISLSQPAYHDKDSEWQEVNTLLKQEVFLTSIGDLQDAEGLSSILPRWTEEQNNKILDYSEHFDRDSASSGDYDTDLESDIDPEPQLQDLTGQDLYLRLCELVGVVPLSCVIRNISNATFQLPHRGIGANGLRAVADPISTSVNARRLNLENNMIGHSGCAFIANIINSNVYITDLNLSYNQLGSRGLEKIYHSIKESSTLSQLNLSSNEFEDQDAKYFAEIIENNISLRSLNLSRNMLSIRAGKLLGHSIANNDTLENLDLSWNAIRLEGAQAFAKGLAANLGLKTLNLSMNGFATDGARAIGIALTLNKYLENLDLSYNRISNSAAVDFARYFRINATLKTLRLHGNPIMYDGAQEILKTIAENERCTIQHLDLRGLMVHQEFIDIVCQIKERRAFTADIGIVSQGQAIQGTVDRFADKNPLEILLIFMGEQNLRLVDLFRSFDKDQSGGLTREEFINGLQEVKTPLTRAQLDELLDMLDKDGDGEIDLKEILNINKEYKDIKMKASRYVQEEKLQKKLEKEGKKETELGAFTKEVLSMKQRSQTMVETSNSNTEGTDVADSSIIAPRSAPSSDQMQASEGLVPSVQAVTTEEVQQLNAQVQTIKTKTVLNMWKNKALV